MLISYNWLKEYFNKLPKPEKLAEILNNRSFEVEGVEKVGEDYVLNIDVLPNRSHDCLCHLGVAREVATVTGAKIKIVSPEKLQNLPTGKFTIESQTNFCRRYIGREIRNVVVGESPVELKNKLKSIGQKSINNIVDITNVVMFELGQPMHAFDSDKLSGDKIIVRSAVVVEKITTLDKQEVALTADDHVIADSSDVLAIAGVKGGKKAEVGATTKNIILESANFVPSNVRKTAKRINIGTESSRRFENEISPAIADLAIDRATELILKYASVASNESGENLNNKTEVFASFDYYPKPWPQYKTGVSLSEIKKLLGLKLSERKVKKVLAALNFEYEIINVREKIVEEAKKYLGKPYKYGASTRYDSPNLFDCSSFTAFVYFHCGIAIPRMSIEQFVFGREIQKSDLLPGDLVFCNTGDTKNKIHFETQEFLKGTKLDSGIDHVGVYIGNDEVIHASSHGKGGVQIDKLSNHPDFSKNTKYARLINDDTVDAKKMDDGRRFLVTIPSERLDIGSMSGIDLKSTTELIEEIGRVYGYENIKDCEIDLPEFKPKINKEYAYNLIIRNVLVNLGFSEVITYSFVSQGELSPEKPISDDKKFLRTSIVGVSDSEGLIGALNKNSKNADLLGTDTIKLFEIGKVFTKEKEGLRLAIGAMNKSGIKKPKTNEVLRTALEKISEKICQKIDLKIEQGANVVEINLDELYSKLPTPSQYEKLPEIADVKYRAISNYPFILRDIAVWLPNNVSNEKLVKIIESKSGELLVKLRLFDEYKKDDKTSFAYRLVFQSMTKTLTDDEINKIMQEITNTIVGKGWEVR